MVQTGQQQQLQPSELLTLLPSDISWSKSDISISAKHFFVAFQTKKSWRSRWSLTDIRWTKTEPAALEDTLGKASANEITHDATHKQPGAKHRGKWWSGLWAPLGWGGGVLHLQWEQDWCLKVSVSISIRPKPILQLFPGPLTFLSTGRSKACSLRGGKTSLISGLNNSAQRYHPTSRSKLQAC